MGYGFDSDKIKATDVDGGESCTSKVWDDQQVDIGNIAGGGWFGSAFSDIVEYRSGVALELENSTSSGYKFKFNAQLSHKYKEGEDIEFHLHIGNDAASSGDVVLKLTYQWANISGTYGSSTTVTKTITMNGSDGYHQLAELAATISGTGKGISSILLCQVERDAGNSADTYSGSVFVIGVDFHIPLDTVGSMSEGSKR